MRTGSTDSGVYSYAMNHYSFSNTILVRIKNADVKYTEIEQLYYSSFSIFPNTYVDSRLTCNWDFTSLCKLIFIEIVKTDNSGTSMYYILFISSTEFPHISLINYLFDKSSIAADWISIIGGIFESDLITQLIVLNFSDEKELENLFVTMNRPDIILYVSMMLKYFKETLL